jgi:hypothetical protein
MSRCSMPPGPEAVECEAWVVAQEMVWGLPIALPVFGFLWGAVVIVLVGLRVMGNGR